MDRETVYQLVSLLMKVTVFNPEYHIQPNYCTVHLGFSKLLEKICIVKYLSNKGTF